MFEYIFAFFPMLYGYSFKGIGLDLIIMIFASLFLLRNQGFRFIANKQNRDFLLLFCYVIIKDLFIVILGQSNSSESFHRLLSNIAYIFLFLILLGKDFNQKKFYKGLKISGTVFTAGLLYHLVLIYRFGLPAKGISIIPGYEFVNNNWLNRPRSFFSEPAALAQAMLPLLFYSLHKKDYKWSLIATFTIFMSTSTAGILLAGVLWIMEFIIGKGKRAHKILVIIVFLMSGAFLLRTEIATDSIAALQNRLSGGGSTSVRVFLGFEILSTMQPNQFITGLLYNKAYDYAVQNIGLFEQTSIARMIVGYSEGEFFINAFVSLVFRYGVVGFILYFRVYKGKIFNKGYAGRALAIMTIVETIGDSMLFNAYYFFIMLVLNYLCQEEENVYESYAYRFRIGQSDAGIL
ncbi:hypothetical protein [Candidatus Merdisoma sp. JLR.KK006]|uniref:hypothetical protein n=1 Tax=Candidatus Merdisoma sp. JLR.KK006 TaxID=3112626 RepID=UPI002FEFF061